MADVKISELTALTTPDGAEELVVNDSGTTKKITIDNLFNQSIDVTGTVTADGLTVGDAGFADHYTQYRDNTQYGVAVGMDASGNSGNGSLLLHGGTDKSIEFTVGAAGGFGTGTPAMVLNTSGNVGIGTSSPTELLEVNSGGATAAIEISAGTPSVTTGEAKLVLRSVHSASGTGYARSEIASIGVAGGDTNLVFRTSTASPGPQEQMRITDTGNVLVGTTSTYPGLANTVSGVSISSNALWASRSGNVVGSFNRNTNDGDIVQFRKDGATVGSIGTSGSALNFMGGAGNDGLQVGPSGGEPYVIPVNNNAIVDAQGSIGLSNYRWKDLYLSGGVYLGGTAAANKLDDYETGTFTPNWVGSTGGSVSGYGFYTKTGRTVTVEIRFESTDHTGFSGFYKVTGLPFTSENTFGDQCMGVGMLYNISWGSGNFPILSVSQNTTEVALRQISNGGGWNTIPVDIGGSRFMRTTFTYTASA